MSTEGVFIDPAKLVLRTKQPTETAKKLETKLEDLFSISILRDIKGKKNKASNRIARSKKTEARRYEAKKMQRQRLEKELTANMESYVMRSVLDPELDLFLSKGETTPGAEQWPISVKWCSRDPRSQHPENSDGEMSPELLLQYAVERICLPSGDSLFHWFSKNASVQQYFVYMFWFVKVKFFRRENSKDTETYLLSMLSAEYVRMVELLSKKSHSEHNKDFIFRYWPYILANAVYFGFYFLCPGSRHLYSKGFRKTILLQIVQVLHGVQLCPISVKVVWSKLFPEEIQDDDEADDEVIPVVVPTNLKRSSSGGNGGAPPSLHGSTSSDNFSAPTSSLLRSASMRNMGILDTSLESGLSSARSSAGILTGRHAAALPGIGEESEEANEATNKEDGDIGAPRVSSLDPPVAVPPLDRVQLKAPPIKSKSFVPRQKRELNDIHDISPLMQQYLSVPTANMGRRAETIKRTIPVNWCMTGGSDTHRRRQLPKELHDELSSRARQAPTMLRKETHLSQVKQVRSVHQIESSYNKVLSEGNAVVGKFSLELVKKLKNVRGLRDIEHDDEALLPASAPAVSVIDYDDDDAFDPGMLPPLSAGGM